MCGVIGVVSNSAANQLLYDGLMVLQHRGQDAAGIVTAEESRFHMHKGQGLARDVFRSHLRHVNTNSDSEVLLNVLAHELQVRASGRQLNLDTIFGAVTGVHSRCKGAYAVVAFIAGYGLLAFRDPHGIRPLVIGVNEQATPHEYIIASESVAIDTLGFRLLRDVEIGRASCRER